MTILIVTISRIQQLYLHSVRLDNKLSSYSERSYTYSILHTLFLSSIFWFHHIHHRTNTTQIAHLSPFLNLHTPLSILSNRSGFLSFGLSWVVFLFILFVVIRIVSYYICWYHQIRTQIYHSWYITFLILFRVMLGPFGTLLLLLYIRLVARILYLVYTSLCCSVGVHLALDQRMYNH
jgi:hypothetical protein